MKILRSVVSTVLLLGVARCGAALGAAPPPDQQAGFGTLDNPLRRGQFETMRALAHDLDGRARDAAASAKRTLSNRSSATRKFLAQLDDFSRGATAFHEEMDAYETHHRDVPDGVLRLERSARLVSDSVRQKRAWAEAAGGWSDVVDALSRMKLVLAGLAVQVPPAHRRLADYARDYGPFPEGRDQGYEQYQRKRAHGGTDDPDYHSKAMTPGTATAPPP